MTKNISRFIQLVIVINILVLPLVYPLDQSRKEIGADKINDFGITGRGNTICLIDDGVDYKNQYLGACTDAQYQSGTCNTIIVGKNVLDNTINISPKSFQYHGTHIAGILISSHQQFKGISPNAKLAVAKIYSNINDSSTCQGFLDAIRWCTSIARQYNVTAISLSYGLNDCSYSSSQFQNAISNATSNGIVFIKSSGNAPNPSGLNITFPAQLDNVTVVGSNTGDKISRYTKRQPTSKLDLLAPGHDIRSTKTGGSLTSIFSEVLCFSDLSFFVYDLEICNSGSSYSVPHVSASVALMREYDTALPAYDIEQLFKETGDDVFDSSTGATFKKLNLLKAFHVFDWPTENHDYRRTGFTLLKGDLKDSSDLKNNVDFFLDAATGSEQVVKPSIADIDNNGNMDQVIAVHKTTYNTFTKLYGTETSKFKFLNLIPIKDQTLSKFQTKQVDGGAIYFPPTIANIDSDSQKEIITGTRNGTVYAFELSGNQLTEKWKYHFEKRIEPSSGIDEVRFNGGNAVADMDLDGDMEVIVADVFDQSGDWPGKVYVLDGATKVNQTSYIVGNGGAYASVSIANIDSDDNPEIIVPTNYGIKVLDYNPGTNKLTEKCSNNHGLIEGSAVIYDVDRDNDYELVYVTNTRVCASGKTCNNKLYIINASSCTIELQKDLTEMPRPTPAVANLDSDSQAEVIISSVSSITPGLGTISAVDSVSGTTQWTYNDGGELNPGFISPNVADVDNDGNYNIILGENDGDTVIVLKNDGSLHLRYPIIGFIDNGLAIADLDNDGVAEIAFKRAASPETVFVSVSNINTPPGITKISNVTAIAGDF